MGYFSLPYDVLSCLKFSFLVRNDKVQLAEMNENPPRRMRTIASANNETNSKIPEKNSEEEQKSRVETLMTTSQNERDAVAVDHGTFSTLIALKLALFF